ncbi:hypothetical protein PORY_001796 [Pneumocystis oryctolagi]|uniref:Uncharacterized protein n=1 Tax=Pneumocystis oryctolagi TaxID=42067 RepID=A0ACB7CCR8_9ASCO|nr:hypothetical protein PORY_001796 [Pneumocystis oryctolagi]
MRLKYRIEKKVSAHNKKKRKEAKKNPKKHRKEKEIGIPNSFPYKDKILKELEAKNLLNVKNKEKNEQFKNKQFLQMEALAEDARIRGDEFNGIKDDKFSEIDEEMESWYGFSEDENDGQEISCIKKDNSLKAFSKTFKDVIDASDVVLYVLDARDPGSTRSQQVEKLVLQSYEKTLVFVLNKIDLVPYTNIMAWLTFLRTSFPCLPLRASTSFSSHSFNHPSLTSQSTSLDLVKFLKSHAHKLDLKRAISVGVVGYPNVGKSSVINILVSCLSGNGKKKPCTTGSEAGTTTSIKQVKLDNKIKLIDSPGVVFPLKNTSREKMNSLKAYEEVKLVLINAIPLSNIVDPIYAVSQILRRLCSDSVLYKELETYYQIPPVVSVHGDITTDFLVHVARKKGRLGKGGVPHLESAAKIVINDWCAGRIHWWEDVPTKDEANGVTKNNTSSSKIESPIVVSEWSKPFSLDDQDIKTDASTEMLMDNE